MSSASLKSVWDCMFSPKLIKIYGTGPTEKIYQPNTLEKWGDQVIHSLYVIWKIGVYSSPFLVGILYQRGYLTIDSMGPLTKLVTSIGVILVVSYCCKGFGRFTNANYTKFLKVVNEANHNLTSEIKAKLCKYDFDFTSWPVEFDMRKSNGSKRGRFRSSSVHIPHNNMLQFVVNIPFRIMAYVAIHTFGIRLIYPGSLGFLQAILEQSLSQGRSKLIECNKGERFKIRTIDSNDIDAMFVDRRGMLKKPGGESPNNGNNGNTLVICTEGNAGFYEIGIMVTAIEAGYSVLGWNHPGFAASTGRPYPAQEQNAMDAIMQFAIEKLNFKPEQIILFGWSIGGYCSSWAALNYPDVKGVVVDATFDDILPLALNHMPGWLEPIVRLAIREHVNLHVADLLVKCPGPILLYRRTEDEVICLKENDLSSNRGNHLLIKLLKARYPYIFEDRQIEVLKQYLALTSGPQDAFYTQKFRVNERVCQSLLQSFVSEYSKSYPMKIGEEYPEGEKTQMALFLARKYMRDLQASHCTNLPPEMFQVPWDVTVESDFVFT